MKIEDLFTAILIIKRASSVILNGMLEIIDGNITAEDASGDIVARRIRRSGKANAGRRWQQSRYVVHKNPELAAISLIGHDDNIVVRTDRFHVRLIEFLNQREDEIWVAA